MLIVISEFMDDDAVAMLAARHTVRYDPDLVDRRDALLQACEAADALIVRNRTRVDAALLAAAPRLRAVGRLGVGLDNIELPACAERGVRVIPATGANARAVAEYVIATTLALLRGAYLNGAQVAAGAWPRTALSGGLEAQGRTLGIVGFGGIGQLTARLARGLDMNVAAHDPMLAADASVWAETGVRAMALDELLAECDAISLHVPLTPQTAGLFDAARLARMKPGAVLVNTARGGIVDEAALAAALRQGALRGAAIDVFEQEPLPAGSPLADVPNLILTPHIAGLTQEANERVSHLVAQRVDEILRA